MTFRTCEDRDFPRRLTRRRWPQGRHGPCSTSAHPIAGATLTAAQACAQQNTGSEATNCTLALLAQRIGVTAGGVSGDGKWTVTITTVTLDVPNNRFLGGPINVAGTIAPVTNMGAAV